MHFSQDDIQTRVGAMSADGLESRELDDALRDIVTSLQATFECSGAGVMLIDDAQALHYASATDDRAAALEAAQETHGRGPCVDALVHDAVVMTDDLLVDERWPRLSEQIDAIGIRSVLGVPIHVGEVTVGSLNVYHDKPFAWDETDRSAIVAHARILERVLALAMLAQERHALADQLSHALENRVAIERAIGLLMGRHGVDAVTAFDALRRQARSQRQKVSDLASEILDERTVLELT